MNQNNEDQWPIKVRDIRAGIDDVEEHLYLIVAKLGEHPMWGGERETVQRMVNELTEIKRGLCIPVNVINS